MANPNNTSWIVGHYARQALAAYRAGDMAAVYHAFTRGHCERAWDRMNLNMTGKPAKRSQDEDSPEPDWVDSPNCPGNC